jgi:hypothetical protein
MLISEAQREVRTAFYGGFVGQLVAGVIWAFSAAASVWSAPRYGMAVLFVVSAMLLPITQTLLRVLGRSGTLSAGNTLRQLAIQVAFTVPIGFILVAAATLHRQHWFYPASMLVVGAHYLPFIFLYGMWQFGVLAVLLILGGVGLGLYGPEMFNLGGWLSAVVFVGFAFVARNAVLKEETQSKQMAARKI